MSLFDPPPTHGPDRSGLPSCNRGTGPAAISGLATGVNSPPSFPNRPAPPSAALPTPRVLFCPGSWARSDNDVASPASTTQAMRILLTQASSGTRPDTRVESESYGSRLASPSEFEYHLLPAVEAGTMPHRQSIGKAGRTAI